MKSEIALYLFLVSWSLVINFSGFALILLNKLLIVDLPLLFFANTSLFESSENIGVLPESASDYLAMRGSGFKDNLIPASEGEYKDIYDLDNLDNKDDKAQPRDYASS